MMKVEGGIKGRLFFMPVLCRLLTCCYPAKIWKKNKSYTTSSPPSISLCLSSPDLSLHSSLLTLYTAPPRPPPRPPPAPCPAILPL